jgi:hypothetical protein
MIYGTSYNWTDNSSVYCLIQSSIARHLDDSVPLGDCLFLKQTAQNFTNMVEMPIFNTESVFSIKIKIELM